MTEAPNFDYAGRVARARNAMEGFGFDVLLASLGSELPYLTGYQAMPLERLTMAVVPRDGDATLVVPELEAPRIEALREQRAAAPEQQVSLGGEHRRGARGEPPKVRTRCDPSP